MTYDNGQEVTADLCDEEARNGLGDKQNKNDSRLRTTAKEIVGAINEVFAGLGDKQNKRDTDLSTVSKNIVGAINEILASVGLKQSKTDNELSTTQKTIVGAINGIDTRVKAIEEGGGGGGGGGDATTLQGHPASYFAKASDLVSSNQAISGLQSSLQITDGLVGGLTNSVTSLETGLSTTNGNVTALDGRVTALEEGGGGGGTGIAPVLLASNMGTLVAGGTITLNESIENYDSVLFLFTENENSSRFLMSTLYPVNFIKNNYNDSGLLSLSKSTNYVNCGFNNSRELVYGGSNNAQVRLIYGVKNGGSGGSGESYSTEEQVIGTWIDGNPIYRKVITVNHTNGEFEYVTALNIDNVIKIYGVGESLTGDRVPLEYNDGVTLVSAYYNTDNKRIGYQVTDQWRVIYTIIEYTKN